MKKMTITAAIIAAISGTLLAGSEQLLPPVLTCVFAISAFATIWGLLERRRHDRV